MAQTASLESRVAFRESGGRGKPRSSEPRPVAAKKRRKARPRVLRILSGLLLTPPEMFHLVHAGPTHPGPRQQPELKYRVDFSARIRPSPRGSLWFPRLQVCMPRDEVHIASEPGPNRAIPKDFGRGGGGEFGGLGGPIFRTGALFLFLLIEGWPWNWDLKAKANPLPERAV